MIKLVAKKVLLLFVCVLPLLSNENSYPLANFYEDYSNNRPTIYHEINNDMDVIEYNHILDSLENRDSLENSNSFYYRYRHLITIMPERYHYSVIKFTDMGEDQINLAVSKIESKEHIRILIFRNCSFKELPDSINNLKSLNAIHFVECDSLRSLGSFNTFLPIFEFYFYNCKIPHLPDRIEKISSMLRLLIHLPDHYEDFVLNEEINKFSRRNNLVDLAIRGKNISEFPENIFFLTSLRTLMFESWKKLNYPYKFYRLNNLAKLTLTCWDEEVENSARENENFIAYYPIDFEYTTLDYSISPHYYDMSNITLIEDPHEFLDNRLFVYFIDSKGFQFRKDTYPFGNKDITLLQDSKEKKIFFSLEGNESSKDSLKVYLLDERSNVIDQGVPTEKGIMLSVENLKDLNYFLKFTIGRYSKICGFAIQ